MTAHLYAHSNPQRSPTMNSLEIHNQYVLEQLNQMRKQASLERQIPRVSMRHQLARALRSLSERLEPREKIQVRQHV